MLKREQIIEAYRWVLGRDPESDAMINYHLQHKDWDTARFRLMNSDEFRNLFVIQYLQRPFFWYIHIPKTAGTAVRNGFAALFGERFFWHPRTEGLEDHSGSVFAAVRANERFFERYDFCGGHLSRDLIPHSRARRKIVFLATLRDPVARALSLYSYARRVSGHDAHLEVRDRTLWEALQLKEIFYHHVYLEQLRYLCGSRDPAVLEKALSEEHYVISEISKIPELLLHINDRYRVPLAHVAYANEGPAGYVEEISRQDGFHMAIDMIRTINAAETELLNRCQPILDSTPNDSLA